MTDLRSSLKGIVDETPNFRAMAQRIVDGFHRDYPAGTEPAETTRIAMEYLKLTAPTECLAHDR